MIELSVRTFFTSDEADIAPKLTAIVNVEKLPEGQFNWAGAVDALARSGRASAESMGVQLTNLRPMTPDEIKEYLQQEQDEA